MLDIALALGVDDHTNLLFNRGWVLADWHCHGAIPAWHPRALVSYQAATLLAFDQELCYLLTTKTRTFLWLFQKNELQKQNETHGEPFGKERHLSKRNDHSL